MVKKSDNAKRFSEKYFLEKFFFQTQMLETKFLLNFVSTNCCKSVWWLVARYSMPQHCRAYRRQQPWRDQWMLGLMGDCRESFGLWGWDKELRITILDTRLKFGPLSSDLGLEAGILALRLGYGLQAWDLDLKTKIWALRLELGPQG